MWAKYSEQCTICRFISCTCANSCDKIKKNIYFIAVFIYIIAHETSPLLNFFTSVVSVIAHLLCCCRTGVNVDECSCYCSLSTSVLPVYSTTCSTSDKQHSNNIVIVFHSIVVAMLFRRPTRGVSQCSSKFPRVDGFELKGLRKILRVSWTAKNKRVGS